MDYGSFLRAKIKLAPAAGIEVPLADINPGLKPHTRDIDQVHYLRAAEREAQTPSLFDFEAVEEDRAAA